MMDAVERLVATGRVRQWRVRCSPFLDKLKERKAIREQREKTKVARKVTKPKKTGTTKVSKTRARGEQEPVKYLRGEGSARGGSQVHMPRSRLYLVTQDVLICHQTLTGTAVVTVIVLFVDFLTVRMTSYGFSVMNVNRGCTPLMWT